MVGIWVEIRSRDNGTTPSHHSGLVKLAIRLALPTTGIDPRSNFIPFRAQSPEKVLESHCQAQNYPCASRRPCSSRVRPPMPNRISRLCSPDLGGVFSAAQRCR